MGFDVVDVFYMCKVFCGYKDFGLVKYYFKVWCVDYDVVVWIE